MPSFEQIKPGSVISTARLCLPLHLLPPGKMASYETKLCAISERLIHVPSSPEKMSCTDFMIHQLKLLSINFLSEVSASSKGMFGTAQMIFACLYGRRKIQKQTNRKLSSGQDSPDKGGASIKI
jgi:hypothetical protein